jgi:hypothetical protein
MSPFLGMSIPDPSPARVVNVNEREMDPMPEFSSQLSFFLPII